MSEVTRYAVLGDSDGGYIDQAKDGRVVLYTDYAALEAECERLRGVLSEARELISHGNFDTGICCCGSDVNKHGFGDGHLPVDEGGYYAFGVMERIDAALSAKP